MLYELDGKRPQFEGEYWVAASATLIGDVVLGANASVWFNAVLRGDCDRIYVGENSNVQDGAVLHTDPGIELRIGRDCTIGHQAMLHGCEIGDNSLIGIQAVVLNRVRVGRNCIVGAKALLTEGKVFPDNSLIVGAPAKVMRQLTDEEVMALKHGAHHYVHNAQRYRQRLKPV